jgi:hypothetical protein
LGGLALATLLNPARPIAAAVAEEKWRGAVNPTHFPPRAKRVIHLCMAGGPSHLESFDNKPELKKIDGQPFPESFTKGQQLAQLQAPRSRRWGRPANSSAGENRGRKFRPTFPTSAALPTTFASCAPCTPSRSTMTRPTPS